jgi:competence protein ComEC
MGDEVLRRRRCSEHYVAADSHRWRLIDPAVVATAVAVSMVAWPGGAVGMRFIACAIAVVVAIAVSPQPARVLAVCVIAAAMVLAWWRANTAADTLDVTPAGDVTTWVRVVDDPRRLGGSTRMLVAFDGIRHEVWLRTPSDQTRVAPLAVGDRVLMAGRSVALEHDRAARVRYEGVTAEFIPTYIADVRDGSALERSVNRVRELVATTASTTMAPDNAALFAGLVIGDDRRQSPEMTARFRASGLSHLTAVSGQNLTLLLAGAAPMLMLCGPRSRWVLSVGLIAWFAAITRFEPSILRAAVMGIGVLTRTLVGRGGSPLRLLAWAVVAVVLLDPLIVSSVGLWLSVGATAGVIAAAAVIRFHGVSSRLMSALLITLGAQIGVMVPMLAVFGRMPVWATPANLLAVPVAGAVMLLGLPAVVCAAIVPPLAPVMMWPLAYGVRWVDAVARVAAAAEPRTAPVWVSPVMVVATCAVVLGTGAAWKRRGTDEHPSVVR